VSALKRIFTFLSSPAALFWLGGAWVFYYVTFAVWSREAFASFVAGLGDNPLIQAPFVVFLLSAFLNMLRSGAGRYRKGKALFALWSVLPAGVFVFLLGFFVSAALRQHAWLIVGEGDALRPGWQEAAYGVEKIRSPLKDEMLDIAGEAGAGVVFQYEPVIVVNSGRGPVEVGAFPPRKIGGTYYGILDFGLAPGVRLLKDGRVLEEGYMLQKLLPPGVPDTFEISPFPYRFTLSIAPARVVEKGRARAKVYNVKTPTYNVSVHKGEEAVFEGGSEGGVSFDGLSLSLFEPVYWVKVQAVKDPGIPLLVGGLALAAAGLPLTLAYLVVRVPGRRQSVYAL
jgi:hypothetical protein